jgi:carbonic anhydrase/acetyltransferase-like protein (isoleucine patch superfamily)
MTENSPLKKFLMPECQPCIHDTAFVASGAVVMGAVTLGENASVWYGCVMRGDINRIVLGTCSNLQDGSIVHVSDDYAAIIGERVSIGHRAIVHACEVGDEVLVGMGAIVMDGAVIGPRSIIGAGAIVTKGTKVPEGSLVLGSPGRVVRTLSLAEQQDNARLAAKYVEVSRRYRQMFPVGAPGSGSVPGAG